jgi:hypothetical protein
MAEQQIVAKWGFPGMPLLPRWFYELLGDKSELISWDGKSITIADLEGTFAAGAKPISKSNEEALSHFVSKRIQTANTDLTQTILCSWGQLAELIDSLPVRTRTRNQIKYRLKRLENLNQFHPQAPFSVEDCYAIPNLGVKSVLDLSCILQLVLDHGLFAGPAEQPVADTGAFNSVVAPGELTGHLSADAPSETSDSPLLRWLKDFAGNSSERDLQILVGQVVRKGDGFMTELAGKFGLTRQRVSQIAIASEKSFRKGSKVFVDQLLNAITPQIPAICAPEQVTDLISTECLEHLSPSGAELEIGANEKICVDVLHAIMRSELKIKMHGEICLSPDLADLLAELVSLLRSTTDDCLLTPVSEVEALFTASGIDIQLLDALNLVNAVGHGNFITLSKSRRGLIKALLLEATEPVEIDEIALAAQTTRSRVSSTLSTIESICRVDRTRYWLRSRVDNPYKGIVQEIERRIIENGGYYDRRDLIHELPNQFGISAQSVNAYVHSKRFSVSGDLVFMGNPDTLELRELESVVHGIDSSGRFFWTFRSSENNFKGYGISDVPPEFVVAIGCPPDQKIKVELLNDCFKGQTVTASWRLHTTSGAYIGNFSAQLVELGVLPGDQVRITASDGGIYITKDGE